MALVCALLLTCVAAHAQAPPFTARVGPLEASVERNAFGACQLRLHNAGEIAIEAWRVSVRSGDARHTTVLRQDAWRDPFHLPLEASRIDPGETVVRPLAEASAVGPLDIRVHLVVRADGIAHGMAAAEAYSNTGPRELELLLERRLPQASEALALAMRIEAAIASEGVARILATRRLSTMLEDDGDWNWWQLAAAIDLLKTAHRVGTARITFADAEPMRPRAVGRCNP